MQQNIHNGFTLIELMIVISIIGILASIAYPSYQESVVKSRRADAKAALLELSVFMERLYTATGCYDAGADKDCTPPNGDAAVPSLPFLVTPKSGEANYDLTVDVTTPTDGFTVIAAPRVTAPDKCGTLTLDSKGVKGVSNSYGYTVGDCW